MLVEGDPTQDVAATLNIQRIVKNGYVLERDPIPIPAGTGLSTPLLGDFEAGLFAAEPFEWSGTADSMAGGNSEATLARTADTKTENSTHALRIDASVKPGFPFPWAGASVALSQSSATTAVDVSSYKSLSFAIKGTPGTYRVMAFSSGAAGIPPTQNIEVNEDWQTLVVRLAEFDGLQAEQLVGFSFVAGPSFGDASFYLDNVRLLN